MKNKIAARNYEEMKSGRQDLPKNYYKYLGRKELTLPWQDHPCAGTLYMLMKYGTDIPLTLFDLAELIYWGPRTIKNQIKQKILRSVIGPRLKIVKIYQNKHERNTYSLDPVFKDANFELVHTMMLDSMFINKFGDGMTSPERVTKDLLQEMFVHNPWKYTGKRSIENRIGIRYPDFIHKNLKLIIEVFGDYWHGPVITEKLNKEHEAERIEEHNKKGYECLILWERELTKKNIDKTKQKIMTFCKKNKAI